MQNMKLVAIYSLGSSSVPESALHDAGIGCEKQVGESEAGTDEVRFLVAEEDFDRAAKMLEQLDEAQNAGVDMSKLSSCPRCGLACPHWHQVEEDTGPVEVLMCPCSGGSPVAFRDPETKRGKVLSSEGGEV